MGFRKNICDSLSLPTSLPWTTACSSILLSIVTVPGNALILIAVIKDPYRNLRTNFNFLVINLVVSDLLLGLITEPMFVVYHILEARQASKPTKIVHVTYFCSLMVSLLSLASLAHERCKAVTSRLRCSSNSSKSLKLSIAIWVCSVSLPWLYFTVDFFHFAFIYVNTAVLLSLIIVVISFYRVREDLQGKVLEWEKMNNDAAKIRAIKRSQKLTKSFLLLLMCFIGCLAPSFVTAYVINFCEECSCYVINWLRDGYFLLPLVNSAVNQFLYPWRMRNFRKAIRKIMKCNAVGRFFHQFYIAKGSFNLNEVNQGWHKARNNRTLISR